MFYLRDFNTNSCHFRKRSLQQCHVRREQEKKRGYKTNLDLFCFQSKAVWEVTRILIAFNTTNIWKEMSSGLISSNWIWKKVCFGQLKLSQLYLRGSRLVWGKTGRLQIDGDNHKKALIQFYNFHKLQTDDCSSTKVGSNE